MSDVDGSPRSGHVCLQLLSEFLLGEPVRVSRPPLDLLSSPSVSSPLPLSELVSSVISPVEPPPAPPFFSFLSGNLPRIIIWKSTPELSHFPGIWLRGGETRDGAGLVGRR